MSKTETETYDAGEPAKVKQRKTKVQLNREREIEEFRKLLDHYEGRAFVWWLLENTGVYQTSFGLDPHITSFNEGKRQIGLLIIERIYTSNPKAYTLMRNEANKREEEK